jgi:hypothetical protein
MTINDVIKNKNIRSAGLNLRYTNTGRGVRVMKTKTITLLTLGGLIVLLVTMALAPPAFAADRSWDSGGGANNNWSTAANWSSNLEPGPSDNAYISNGGTALITSAENVNYVNLAQTNGSSGHINMTGGSLSAVSIDPGYLGTGTITQSGGAMSMSQWFTLAWGTTGVGTYNLSGGTFNNTGASTGVTLAYQGTGTINQSGGTFTVANWTTVGSAAGSHGYLNLSGTGEFNTAGLNVGQYGAGEVTQTGGTLNQNGATATTVLGNQAGGQGIYTLNGGILNSRALIVGSYGTGTLTQNGGAATVSSKLYMGRYSGGVGTYNLNGGSLSVASFDTNQPGTSTFNVNGVTTSGTIDGAWTTLPVDNFNVGSSGSFTLASGKTLQATSITDAGTLTVNGNATGSTLNVTGTLKGSGTLTGLNTTIASGGTINPGNSPGTMTLSGGTMTWAPGGTAIFEIVNAAGTAGSGWDLINLTNSAVLDITATEQNPFNIIIRGLSSTNPDVLGDPANYSPLTEYKWLFVDDAGGSIQFVDNIFDPNAFNISVEGFPSGGTFEIVIGTMSVLGNKKTDVPEIPAGLLIPLLGLIGGAMIWLRKKAIVPTEKK